MTSPSAPSPRPTLGRIGNYTYGSSRPHAVTAAGSNTYTSYDNNGNLLLGGGRSLTWDANNMVTQVVMGGNTTTFTYGPDGDRIKKTSSSTTLKYPFGDDYEINGSTVTKYFNAGFGVIAKKVGTTLYWLHGDRLGSINATTDGSGAEVLRRSYRSYGELLGQTGTHTESLGYIGQRTDGETGLAYLHARYYDSSLGMFVSPDPSFILDTGVGLNRYAYSPGDPINAADSNGRFFGFIIGLFPHFSETVTVTASASPIGIAATVASAILNIRSLIHSLFGGGAPSGGPSGGTTGDGGEDAPGQQQKNANQQARAQARQAAQSGAPSTTPPVTTPPVVTTPTTPGVPPLVRSEFVEVVGRAPAVGTSMLEVSVTSTTITTAAFDLCANARAAKQHKFDLIRLLSRVHSGGTSDLKQIGEGIGGETVGNANFMLEGLSAGFPEGFLRRGAGAYQWYLGLRGPRHNIYGYGGSQPDWGSPFGEWPFGDDPRDQTQMDLGKQLFQSGVCG